MKKYAKFVIDNFDGRREFVFRGQQSAEWKIESSFRRIANGLPADQADPSRHLENFRAAARGRRGINPPELTEDEWWALGQHYGLATPLVDWTRSYWVALYFTFCAGSTQVSHRAVYALDLQEASRRIPGDIKLVDPEVHDNPRLINQAGMLLEIPVSQTLEDCITQNFVGDERVILLKVVIPNLDIEYCIRDLNRMNINHLTLFPDLSGAVGYANTAVHVPELHIPRDL